MTSEQQHIVQTIAEEVKLKFEGEGSGHDWWHIVRVWNMAKRIAQDEQADAFVVELTALLHDIADWKFHNGDDTVGPRIAREMLIKQVVSSDVIDHVCEIIATMSYKGAGVETPMQTPEGKVVQDADRLDAIGAIGIARTFAYGGHKNRLMHDPTTAPQMHQSKKAYSKSSGPTINHFYEKLLLLKDRMNTQTAKAMAQGRHEFMQRYLEQFFEEWEGNR